MSFPPLDDLPWPVEGGDQQAVWINGDGMRLVEFLFYEARHTALIDAPAVNQGTPGMEALIAAVSTGTNVRMMLGSPLTNPPRSLLEVGGRVWEYGRAPLTTRMVVIDGAVSFVGSPLGGMVLVQGEPLARTLTRDFEEDTAAAHEITLGSLPRPARERRRPLIRRVGSWVARAVQRRKSA